MKINHATIYNYSTGADGSISLIEGDGTSITIKLTASEAQRIFSVMEDIAMERKLGLAEQIAKMQPMALADFSEVDASDEVLS